MTNPNRTVFLARNRVWELVAQYEFPSLADARRNQEMHRQFHAEGGNVVTRVTSYVTGPRTKPLRHWLLRIYRK